MSQYAEGNEEEARRNIRDQDAKVRDELIKRDPSLQAVYDRVGFDRHVLLDSGDQKIVAEYGTPRPYLPYLQFLLISFQVLLFMRGFFLLFSPPSWAGAHLYLICLMLPIVCFGPVIYRDAVFMYLERFDQIRMPVPMPRQLSELRQELIWMYLYFVPSLLLYTLILFRIRLKERSAEGSTSSLSR